MPEKKEAEQAMIDRQLELLKNSPAMAFEGFLPLAKQLQENEQSNLLIAKALYGFFQWDRKSTQPSSEAQPQQNKRQNHKRQNNRKRNNNRRRRD